MNQCLYDIALWHFKMTLLISSEALSLERHVEVEFENCSCTQKKINKTLL